MLSESSAPLTLLISVLSPRPHLAMFWLRPRHEMERADGPHSRTPPLPAAEGEQTRSLGICCFIRLIAEILEELCRGNVGVQKWERVPGA